MDPISQANPVLEALRRQLAENIERLRRSGKLAAGTRSGAAAARSPGAAEDLEAALRRKLAGIDRRSSAGLSAATRVFVETVLVGEFGAGLLTDPGFGQLAAELSESLREEAEVREPLERMLAEL